MTKKKEKKVNVSGKPKHSLDANRKDGKNDSRSAATVRRLKMYNTRPKRDRKGHILQHEFQSKELPSTRIQPDRRWFGTLNFLLSCIKTICLYIAEDNWRALELWLVLELKLRWLFLPCLWNGVLSVCWVFV